MAYIPEWACKESTDSAFDSGSIKIIGLFLYTTSALIPMYSLFIVFILNVDAKTAHIIMSYTEKFSEYFLGIIGAYDTINSMLALNTNAMSRTFFINTIASMYGLSILFGFINGVIGATIRCAAQSRKFSKFNKFDVGIFNLTAGLAVIAAMTYFFVKGSYLEPYGYLLKNSNIESISFIQIIEMSISFIGFSFFIFIGMTAAAGELVGITKRRRPK